VIFCRNVMIYFDQRRAPLVHKLTRQLLRRLPAIGHSESLMGIRTIWNPFVKVFSASHECQTQDPRSDCGRLRRRPPFHP
jgi:chemotaxis methyl-accepting protein methylase